MEEANTVIEESSLRFTFDEDTEAVKFDDTDFYRRRFSSFPGAKGIDILAESTEIIQLIEIKNCTGHESENIWRTSVNNSKIESAPRGLDMSRRNRVAFGKVWLMRKYLGTEKSYWSSCFWRGILTLMVPEAEIKIWLCIEFRKASEANWSGLIARLQLSIPIHIRTNISR